MPSYDLDREFHLLELLSHSDGPPVPGLRSAAVDRSTLGRPYYVMDRIIGSTTNWGVNEWLAPSVPTDRAAMSAAWIDAMATLHRMPVEPFSFLPSVGFVEESERWLRMTVDSEGPPSLIALLQELVRRPAVESGPRSVVHGDFKFGNMLWSDTFELVGLLDWEFTQVSEPLLDLGYVLGLWPKGPGDRFHRPYTQLDGWWSHTDMIRSWSELTGRDVVDLERYEQLGMAKIGAIFARGWHIYRTGLSRDARLGRWDRALGKHLDAMQSRGLL